jgi:cytochrome c553
MKIPLIVIIFSSLLVILAYSNSSYQNYARVHDCSGSCYDAELQKVGTLSERLAAKMLSLSNKTTVELGQDLYGNNCLACHGASGEGGIGPRLTGQSGIVDMLQAYKRKETRGPQSNIMWANAQQLSTQDMENLSQYIDTLKY